jgi:hypothetical protein
MNPYGTAALVCFLVAFAASGVGAIFAYAKRYTNTAFLFTFLAVISLGAFAYYGIQ